MNAVVLDTDVWSFLFKRDTRAEYYRQHLEGNVLSIAFQTVAELYQWAEINAWGARRRQKLGMWLRRFQVLGYDDETALIWAKIRAARMKEGQPLSAQDAWVSACALRHGYPLLTHNSADYVGIDGLVIVTATATE